MAINLTDKLYASTGSQVIADAIQVAGGYMAITQAQFDALTDAQKCEGTLVYITEGNNVGKTFRYNGSSWDEVIIDDLVTLTDLGITATSTELNVLDGIATSTTELNKLHGLTPSTTELNYVKGVTSGIQTQLNNKAPLASPALTGTPTAPTAAVGTNTTQIANTAFVKAEINSVLAASDAMIFKGTLGTGGTITTLPANHSVGDTYKVITAGTYADNTCEVGDMIVCITNGTSANNAHWTVIQTNTDGHVTGPTNAVANHIPVFDGTTGKLIKDSGFTIGTSVPANAKFTDTNTNYYHSNGSWNGLTYTATANGGAPELKLTIPTGTSGTTVALGNHTHKYAGSDTVGGSATSAVKLDSSAGTSTLPVYFKDGKPTAVVGMGEAYLTWGGKNFAGNYGPIDAAMIPQLGANRLAFVPAAGVTLEYSTDNGNTWIELTDNTTKLQLFSAGGSNGAFYIGNSSESGIDKSTYKCRITLTTGSEYGKVYSQLNKFAIFISTSGSTNPYCSIDARLESDRLSGTDTWVNFAENVPLQGWSGWNIINTDTITTFGNSPSQYGQLRFTFGVESHPASVTYPGLTIQNIMGFGGVGWTTPSNMAKYGTIYKYDASQNVEFPAKVTANTFVATGSSISDLSAGSIKVDTLQIPTTSNGTTYGKGTNGQILRTNGNTIYWGDSNDEHTHSITDIEGLEARLAIIEAAINWQTF